MGRCLPSTVVLFRREISLEKAPSRAMGYILADSRYRLVVNGKRIQWGPAPFDPRWPEADPLDLAAHLRPGKNVIACSVLFFGHGDGAWAIGKPGFLFRLGLEWEDGRTEQVVSNETWRVHLARSWQPGHYKRWFLRAFQEEFDARSYPHGWDETGFAPDDSWVDAVTHSKGGDKPSVCSSVPDYLTEMGTVSAHCSIRRRSVPMLAEPIIEDCIFQESAWIRWKRPAEQYFESLIDDAFTGEWSTPPRETAPGAWEIEPNGEKAASVVFAHNEQMVGWPCFTVDAPAGTVIEMLVHEAHKPGGPFILNSHFHAWSRFICKEGENQFESFDFESYWALAKGRAMQVVLDDLRRRWGKMDSVRENNTIQESWNSSRDSTGQWSHCAMAPLILFYHGILGLKPLRPGFEKCLLFPQLGDLKQVALVAHTVRGGIRFAAKQRGTGCELTIFIPAGIHAELVLPSGGEIGLPAGDEIAPANFTSYVLPAGKEVIIQTSAVA